MEQPDFTSAEQQYQELRRKRTAGKLGATKYRDQVNALRVQDNDGNWWQPDPDREGWLSWNGTAWVSATPPGLASAAAAGTAEKASRTAAASRNTKPPTTAKAAKTPKDAGTRKAERTAPAAKAPPKKRSQQFWDRFSIMGGVVAAVIWFLYSSIRGVSVEGIDWITPIIMIGMPVALARYRKEIDHMLLPLQTYRKKLAKPVIFILGIAAPIVVAFVLYNILGIEEYTLLHLNLIIGPLIAYAIMRTPVVEEEPALQKKGKRGVAVGAIVLGALFIVVPAVAHDCLSDPLNANDCLRTDGTAQVIAGGASLVMTVLINGPIFLQGLAGGGTGASGSGGGAGPGDGSGGEVIPDAWNADGTPWTEADERALEADRQRWYDERADEWQSDLDRRRRDEGYVYDERTDSWFRPPIKVDRIDHNALTLRDADFDPAEAWSGTQDGNVPHALDVEIGGSKFQLDGGFLTIDGNYAEPFSDLIANIDSYNIEKHRMEALDRLYDDQLGQYRNLDRLLDDAKSDPTKEHLVQYLLDQRDTLKHNIADIQIARDNSSQNLQIQADRIVSRGVQATLEVGGSVGMDVGIGRNVADGGRMGNNLLQNYDQGHLPGQRGAIKMDAPDADAGGHVRPTGDISTPRPDVDVDVAAGGGRPSVDLDTGGGTRTDVPDAPDSGGRPDAAGEPGAGRQDGQAAGEADGGRPDAGGAPEAGPRPDADTGAGRPGADGDAGAAPVAGDRAGADADAGRSGGDGRAPADGPAPPEGSRPLDWESGQRGGTNDLHPEGTDEAAHRQWQQNVENGRTTTREMLDAIDSGDQTRMRDGAKDVMQDYQSRTIIKEAPPDVQRPIVEQIDAVNRDIDNQWVRNMNDEGIRWQNPDGTTRPVTTDDVMDFRGSSDDPKINIDRDVGWDSSRGTPVDADGRPLSPQRGQELYNQAAQSQGVDAERALHSVTGPSEGSLQVEAYRVRDGMDVPEYLDPDTVRTWDGAEARHAADIESVKATDAVDRLGDVDGAQEACRGTVKGFDRYRPIYEEGGAALTPRQDDILAVANEVGSGRMSPAEADALLQSNHHISLNDGLKEINQLHEAAGVLKK